MYDIVVDMEMGVKDEAQKKLSSGHEEYLELIYRSEESNRLARTSEIAATLRVGLGTVTKVIDRLEKKGFVFHRPYQGITLTEKGREIGIKILERHRIIERFLKDVLDIDSNHIHNHACKLEHVVDDELIGAIKKFLKQYPDLKMKLKPT